jgi:long-subunit fatty acid transport protein
MKNVMTAGAALLLTTSIATAGGLDRSGQGIGFIFEEGDAAFASIGVVTPTVSSEPEALAGDVGVRYTALSFGYKTALSDQIDLSLIVDQPYGANVAYETGPLIGTEAEVSSFAVTSILSYSVSENVTAFGGLRLQSIKGTVAVPAAGYELESDASLGFGYVIGAAYEVPDIALRVALTYNSSIKHTLDSVENSPTLGFVPTDTEFDIELPQSVNLDFQSGVAQDTLVFGSIRWVEWSTFDITPTAYIPGSLVDYSDDVFTYTLGVGRKFSDTFSASFSVSYEESTGDPAPNLGPTDGFISYSIGGEYTMNANTKLRGGIRYIDIGDTVSDAGIPFEDNSALALGASITYSY